MTEIGKRSTRRFDPVKTCFCGQGNSGWVGKTEEELVTALQRLVSERQKRPNVAVLLGPAREKQYASNEKASGKTKKHTPRPMTLSRRPEKEDHN